MVFLEAVIFRMLSKMVRFYHIELPNFFKFPKLHGRSSEILVEEDICKRIFVNRYVFDKQFKEFSRSLENFLRTGTYSSLIFLPYVTQT